MSSQDYFLIGIFFFYPRAKCGNSRFISGSRDTFSILTPEIISDMISGVKIENVSRDPDHAYFRGGLSSKS